MSNIDEFSQRYLLKNNHIEKENPRYSDILVGYEFHITFKITTPLFALKHYLEINTGSIEELPEYGSACYGIWLPKMKTYRELGVDIDELPESNVASDIGHANPKKYYQFLVDFRIIYESNDAYKNKICRINSLKNVNDEYSEYLEKLKTFYSFYNDFPCFLFILDFIKETGLNYPIAKKLIDINIWNINDIKNANINVIKNIKGIGPKTLGKIIELQKK